MRYILCFLLPDDLSFEINLLREHFEKGVSLKIAPHISLTYPFWSKGKTEELAGRIEKVSLGAAVGEVGGVGVFEKDAGKRVIFAKVWPEEPFIKMHKKLTEALSEVTFDTRFFPGNKLPEKYQPHITIAMNGKEKDVEFVQKKLQKIKGKEFLMGQITLLSNKNPKEGWKIERIFKLKM